MARGFQGGIGPGTLLAGITDVATTITSNALANLRVITAPETDVARLGAPGPNEELVEITAHTASSTSATVVRGHLGTTARAWSASDPFDISVITPDDVGGGGGADKSVDEAANWTGLLTESYEFDAETGTLPTGWAWVNQGGASYDESFGSGKISAPTSSGAVNLRILKRAVPSGNFTAYAKFSRTTQIANFNESGFVLRDSVSGELITWGWGISAAVTEQVTVQRWNSPTVFNSQTAATTYGNLPPVIWLRITKNSATDWDFGLSLGPNGGWIDMLAAHDPSGFLTVDEIGFQTNPRNAGTTLLACHWMRFK